MNVEITWFDGELAAPNNAPPSQHATRSGTLLPSRPLARHANDPVKKMIDAGTPVIAMDTMMAPEGQLALHTFIAPDNVFMGSVVTNELMKKIGGKGNVVMTQGALGHTGAQGRAKGFKEVVANFPDVKVVDEQPADWDVTKVARSWESLLTKYPDIAGAFFHNDD